MSKIVSIEKLPLPEYVYDPCCDYPHAYISNNFVSHNCIVLVDECEKLFNGGSDQGVTSRILSQLLWWMQAHRSRVFTIMTTNDSSAIPQELYRSGRIDKSFQIEKLSSGSAQILANQIAQSFGVELTWSNKKIILNSIDLFMESQEDNRMSHAQVTQCMYDLIKEHKWC